MKLKCKSKYETLNFMLKRGYKEALLSKNFASFKKGLIYCTIKFPTYKMLFSRDLNFIFDNKGVI